MAVPKHKRSRAAEQSPAPRLCAALTLHPRGRGRGVFGAWVRYQPAITRPAQNAPAIAGPQRAIPAQGWLRAMQVRVLRGLPANLPLGGDLMLGWALWLTCDPAPRIAAARARGAFWLADTWPRAQQELGHALWLWPLSWGGVPPARGARPPLFASALGALWHLWWPAVIPNRYARGYHLPQERRRPGEALRVEALVHFLDLGAPGPLRRRAAHLLQYLSPREQGDPLFTRILAIRRWCAARGGATPFTFTLGPFVGPRVPQNPAAPSTAALPGVWPLAAPWGTAAWPRPRPRLLPASRITGGRGLRCAQDRR